MVLGRCHLVRRSPPMIPVCFMYPHPISRSDVRHTFCTLGCSVCLGVVLGSATSPGRLNLMLPARDGEALDRWLPPGGGDGRRGRPIEAWGKAARQRTAAPECLRVAGPAVTSNRR